MLCPKCATRVTPPARACLRSPDARVCPSPLALQYGAARRPCAGLGADVQVQHRCHCTEAGVCGDLERRVTEAMAQGKMPPLPPPRKYEEAQYEIERW